MYVLEHKSCVCVCEHMYVSDVNKITYIPLCTPFSIRVCVPVRLFVCVLMCVCVCNLVYIHIRDVYVCKQRLISVYMQYAQGRTQRDLCSNVNKTSRSVRIYLSINLVCVFVNICM